MGAVIAVCKCKCRNCSSSNNFLPTSAIEVTSGLSVDVPLPGEFPLPAPLAGDGEALIKSWKLKSKEARSPLPPLGIPTKPGLGLGLVILSVFPVGMLDPRRGSGAAGRSWD